MGPVDMDVHTVAQKLGRKLAVKNRCEPTQLLGVIITFVADQGVLLSRTKLIHSVLAEARMTGCKLVRAPLDQIHSATSPGKLQSLPVVVSHIAALLEAFFTWQPESGRNCTRQQES